jgi:hypothetical protein
MAVMHRQQVFMASVHVAFVIERGFISSNIHLTFNTNEV